MMEFSKGKAVDKEDFEARFSEMRIRRSENPARQTYHEMIKNYFKNNQELCDWIINLWMYAKYMNCDDKMNTYALCNRELIKDQWDNEKYISCEFLLNHLMNNDPSFFNFEIFIQPKNLMINKAYIYDIIKLPIHHSQIQPVSTKKL